MSATGTQKHWSQEDVTTLIELGVAGGIWREVSPECGHSEASCARHWQKVATNEQKAKRADNLPKSFGAACSDPDRTGWFISKRGVPLVGDCFEDDPRAEADMGSWGVYSPRAPVLLGWSGRGTSALG